MAEKIILLHGIFRTARSMRGLERFLRGHGFNVLNLDYPSTQLPLEDIVTHVHPQIVAFAAGDAPVHFVGYSMGGLVTRAYLMRYPLPQLGRVMLLATPNHGSEIADLLKPSRLYRRVYGPAGQQLGTDGNTALFGPVTYPLGILAGNRSIDPLCWLLLPKPNDGKVSVAATKLDEMAMHRVVPVGHTLFPSNRLVWRETLAFLKGD